MTETTAGVVRAFRREGGSVTALGLAPVISYADRFGYLPVSTAIAMQDGVSPVTVALSVTLYLVAYGICQPVWGGLSDRIGRRSVLLVGLIGLAIADLAAFAVPGGAALVACRVAAGVMSGALLPTTLAAVGDLVAPAERHQVVSRLIAWASVGAAAAMLLGGVVAARFGWRSALGLMAVLAALGAVVAFARVPGSPASDDPARGALRQLWSVRARAARLYAFAFAEGIVMLGAFPLIAPALRDLGQTSAGTGMTMAAYGLAAVAGSSWLRRLSARDPVRPVLAGGVLLFVGLIAAAAVATNPLLVASAASASLGAAFSLFHSRFQVMATELAPQARGIGTGVFVGMVFTGASIGTAAGTALAASWGYVAVFLAAAMVSLLVAMAGYLLARNATPGS